MDAVVEEPASSEARSCAFSSSNSFRKPGNKASDDTNIVHNHGGVDMTIASGKTTADQRLAGSTTSVCDRPEPQGVLDACAHDDGALQS